MHVICPHLAINAGITGDETVVVIRAGTAADAQAAASLVSLADIERRGHSPVDANAPERAVRRLTDVSTFFHVAESQGELIGIAAGMPGRLDGGAGEPIPGLCHISMVAVRPGHWGHGLGKQVLRAVVAEAHRRGFERAQLFTQAVNARARALYEGHGFVLTGQGAVDEIGDETVRYVLAPLGGGSPGGEDQGLYP
jgi:ribosomal protein S18 acetylase RimI-like enzyme